MNLLAQKKLSATKLQSYKATKLQSIFRLDVIALLHHFAVF